MDNIGQIIKHLREINGMTQKELGRLTNVRQGTISMIECGQSLPSWGLAQRLANLFQMSLVELLSYDIPPVAEQSPTRALELA